MKKILAMNSSTRLKARIVAAFGVIATSFMYGGAAENMGRADGYVQASPPQDDRSRANSNSGNDESLDLDVQSPNPAGNAWGLSKRMRSGGGSSGISKADFNGDGFADLAIGVPLANPSGVHNAGAVSVIYGSATGLAAPVAAGTTPLSQLWSQNSAGIPNESYEEDRWGSALAAGDFNGDGFSDLAVGDPGKTFEAEDGICSLGVVHVIYGSASGLTGTPPAGVPAPQEFNIFSFPDPQHVLYTLALGAASPNDCPTIGSGTFGWSLTWGDFDGDGIGDLAVGIPTQGVNVPFTSSPVGTLYSGVVEVFFGSANAGLSNTASQVITPFIPEPFVNYVGGTEDQIEDLEFFGTSLAAGDFNGDGKTDLAVGAPYKDVGRALFNAGKVDAGVVMIFHAGGSPGAGLQHQSVTTFRKGGANDIIFNNQGVGGVATKEDLWGSSLAAGDFNGDRKTDLAIGSPFEDLINPARTNAGGIDVLYSSRTPFGQKLSTINHQFWTQDLMFVSPANDDFGGKSEAGDRFGFALAAGDFSGDGFMDLAIGAPFENVIVSSRSGEVAAGEVDVIYGSASGLARQQQHPPQRFRQSAFLADPSEAGDHFGFSLSAWNFGRNQIVPPLILPRITADLAIGVPDEDLGNIADAGAVNIIYGDFSSATGTGNLSGLGGQVWTLNSTGVPGSAEIGDRLGFTLY